MLVNALNTATRLLILRCLLEGNSIRSTARIVGCAKASVLRLLSNVGQTCLEFHEDTMKNVPCKQIQVDEIWSFIYSKKSKTKEVSGKGESWTWIAICCQSKVVPCWYVGDRTAVSAGFFIEKLSHCVDGQVQISSDGLKAYQNSIRKHLPEADFGMLIKHYVKNKAGGKLVLYKEVIQGNPDPEKISTSYVERHNLNVRMSLRRFTRKTNAFSKNLQNHSHALSLYFFYYNFVRKHKTLKTTPANAKGLVKELDLNFLIRRVG